MEGPGLQRIQPCRDRGGHAAVRGCGGLRRRLRAPQRAPTSPAGAGRGGAGGGAGPRSAAPAAGEGKTPETEPDPDPGRGEPRGARSGRLGPVLPPEEGGRPARASAAPPQPRRGQEAPQGHFQPGCCSPAAVPPPPPARKLCGRSPQARWGGKRGAAAAVSEPGAPAGPPRRPAPPRRLPPPHAAAVYPRRVPIAARRDGRRRPRRFPRQPGPAPSARGPAAARRRGRQAACGARPPPGACPAPRGSPGRAGSAPVPWEAFSAPPRPNRALLEQPCGPAPLRLRGRHQGFAYVKV